MAWPLIIAGAATVASAYIGSQAAGRASSAQTSAARRATDAELEMFYQGRADMAPWREAGQWALGYQQDPVKTGPMLGFYDWMKEEGRSEFKPPQRQQQWQPILEAQSRDAGDSSERQQQQQPSIDPNQYAYQAYVDDWKQKQGTFTPSDEFREGSLLDRIDKGPGKFKKSPGYKFRLKQGVKAMERGAAARGNVLSGAQQKDLTRFGQQHATADYDNFLRRYYDSLKPLQSMAGVGQTTASQGAAYGGQVGRSIGQNYLTAGQARASGYINQANVLSGAMTSGVENYLMYDYLNRPGQGGGSPRYPNVSTIRGGQGGGYGF